MEELRGGRFAQEGVGSGRKKGVMAGYEGVLELQHGGWVEGAGEGGWVDCRHVGG